MKIAIIGDGGWGTTLAIILSRKGYKVSLWGAFPEYVRFLKEKRENVKFLPSIPIPKEILITADLEEALSNSKAIVLAVPSQFMRSVINKLKGFNLSDSIIVSVTKGIENKTLKRMSEVIEELLGEVRLAVLSGPSIAIEVARGIPTTVVAASQGKDICRQIQTMFSTDRFRVYTNQDVTGVELGGALKNIIAIAAGISDGLGFGTNTKAALLTRGLVEITRLGVNMGADMRTFEGLSGMGDMVTTCISPHGRNRWLGEEIGRGKKLKDIISKTEMVVEGVSTTESAYELSKKNKVDMPIIREIYAVLFKNKDPLLAVNDLMKRKTKSEID
jgi:glycerol-3-phosphate dehydrogenase (NAD(P)+)